jgi:phosphatidylglycerol:prolipoprotein diacylglycerol transferase
MYPILFRIGSFEVTTFGVLVAIAALVGIWLFSRELARSGLPRDAVDAAVFGVIGGLVGAKVLWTVEFLGDQPVTDLLFSRGGLSWFGGLIGGVGTGLWMPPATGAHRPGVSSRNAGARGRTCDWARRVLSCG